MWQYDRKIFAKPISAEPQQKKLVPEAGFVNSSVLSSDPLKDCAQQHAPTLGHADARRKRIGAFAFFIIIANIFRNTYAALTIKDAGDVANLQISQHRILALDNTMQYTPFMALV